MSRSEEIEMAIRQRLGSVYTSRATMDDCVARIEVIVGQAVREERERCRSTFHKYMRGEIDHAHLMAILDGATPADDAWPTK